MSKFSRAILSLVFVFLTGTAHAANPRVVLLSSVSVRETKIPLLKQFYEGFDRRMERVFRREMKKILGTDAVDVVVIDNADLHDAWDAVHSPDNVAVFWLSHAGWATNGGSGLQNDDLIVDKAGFNIKKALENPDPNLRWLSVISCNSEKILSDLKSENYFNANPGLTVQGYDQKVVARHALIHSVRASRDVIAWALINRQVSDAPSVPSFNLVITRHTPTDSPPVSIEVGGKVVGVFPSAQGAETQTLTVAVPAAGTSPLKARLKIVFDSGTIFSADQLGTDLGSFDMQAPWSGATWSLFATPDGHPIGVGTRIYRYTGPDTPPAN